MTRENFINDIAAAAKELGKKNNILPSLIMGVACHESNFGNSELAEKGNNLFGVKGTYEGQSVLLPTWEVIDGVRHDIQAAFRKYPSYRESIQDFCNLLVNGVSWNREIYHSVLGVNRLGSRNRCLFQNAIYDRSRLFWEAAKYYRHLQII